MIFNKKAPWLLAFGAFFIFRFSEIFEWESGWDFLLKILFLPVLHSVEKKKVNG